MNLLFFCFAFLALQELLIEGGPHKRANRKGSAVGHRRQFVAGSGKKAAVGNKRQKSRKTSQPKSTSAQQRFPGQKSIYGKSFQREIIAYLTEDDDPVYFGARNLKNGRRGWANNEKASNFQSQADWKTSPEVDWALKDLEAFATLKVTYKDQKDSEYYYDPNSKFFAYTSDKTFNKAPGLHQVAAIFNAKGKPTLQICCSVFVRILGASTPGIGNAYCGHPICYAPNNDMLYWSNKNKFACHPPPIRGQPSTSWAFRLCKTLIIAEKNY